MNIKNRIAIGVAAGSLVLNSFATTAFAATTIQITGNGVDTNNTVNVTSNNTVTVTQSNTSNITNNVSASANTGGNDANRNTGGNVSIDTGNATTNVSVSTATNLNSAQVSPCGACTGNTTVEISGNGDRSDNNLDLNANKTTSVYQLNDAYINNDVDASAKTGKNDANSNTGGSVSIDTGNATTNVSVSNKANANLAQIGSNGSGGSGSLSIVIAGNGVDSDNNIGLKHNQAVVLTQDNFADIYNYVDARAKTGGNDANSNTGGNVSIDTGSAKAGAIVDNRANFNSASVDCGCLLNELVKVAGNGDNSDNTILAALNHGQAVWQDNCGDLGLWEWHREGCNLDNYLDVSAKTGKNDADSNTGGVANHDPGITTGDATDYASVANQTNVNLYGPSLSLPSPFPFPNHGLNLNLTWDLGMLWVLLGNS